MKKQLLCFLALFTLSLLHAQLSEAELMGQGNPILKEGPDYRLRPEAADAFEAMRTAAAKDGIQLTVVSSYRDYAHQNRIWERKFKRFRESGDSALAAIERIIEYSTIPGTSRHHWGTDLDLIDGKPNVKGDVLVPSKFHGNGPFCKMKAWMDDNAERFGFYLVYTDTYDRKGFHYEPWHYSYKPLSQKYLKQYKTLDLQAQLEKARLLGSTHLTPAFIQRYREENVLDINPQLLD